MPPSVGSPICWFHKLSYANRKSYCIFKYLAYQHSIIVRQHRQARALFARAFCRCNEFRERAQSFVYRGEVSRIQFTKHGAQGRPNRRQGHAFFPTTVGRLPAKRKPLQFAITAYSNSSSQTRNNRRADKAFERLVFLRPSIHETPRTDIFDSIHLPPPLLTVPRFFIV